MGPNSKAKPHDSQQQVLEARARELARRVGRDQEERRDLSMVTFALGRERYGVEMSYLREVRPLKKLHWSPVPCTPSFIVGVVNLRGRLYSMMDLSSFLGAGIAEVSEQSHVLLVGGGSQPGGGQIELGLLSEHQPQIHRMTYQELQDPQDTVSKKAHKYIQGVTKEMVTLLDLNNLLSDPAIVIG